MKHNEYKPSFFIKYKDILAFGVSVMGVFYWMHSEFKEVNANIAALNSRLLQVESDLNSKLLQLESEISIVKTVMILKNIMPESLAKED